MFVTGINGSAYIRAVTYTPTSTYFEVVTTNTAGTIADTSFSFTVMAFLLAQVARFIILAPTCKSSCETYASSFISLLHVSYK